MNEPKFSHQFRQESYDKAMLKYDKMIETENGQKFLAHLMKAFLQSGTERKVEDSEDGKGTLICDLTKSKVVTVKNFESFKATYKAKIETFERNEGEEDDQFENRRNAYIEAFKSSNPYACNADFAYTADKTDKVLCHEAIDALAAKFNAIKDDPKYAEFMKLIEVKIHSKKNKIKKGDKKQHKQKNQPRVYSSSGTKSTTLGDLMGDKLKELKGKLED